MPKIIEIAKSKSVRPESLFGADVLYIIFFRLINSFGEHCVGDLSESRQVCARDEVVA